MWLLLCTIGLGVTSCRSKKSVVESEAGLAVASDAAYLRGVVSGAPAFDAFSAKMKLAIKMGGESLSVGGSIKMKRDERIQLSLVAVGIVEAARIEISPERVLVLDRIGRRYVEVEYGKLKFFEESKIDFYTLQALFCNELFLPGVKHVTENDVRNYMLTRDGEQATLTAGAGKRLTYSFLTALTTGQLQESRVHASSSRREEGYRMDWSYTDFSEVEGREFPQKMNLALRGTEKPMSATFSFSRCSATAECEPLKVPARYKRVEATDLLKLLLAL